MIVFPLPPAISANSELVIVFLNPPKIEEWSDFSSMRFCCHHTITVLDESIVVLSDHHHINDCVATQLIDQAQFLPHHTTIMPSPSA